MPDSLVAVIVGGLLTLAGGMIGAAATILMSWRQARIDKAKQRAAKFEELVQSVYDLEYWLETQQDILIYGSTEKAGPSPLSRMDAIGAAYFPGFLQRIAVLKLTLAPYKFWMGQAAERKQKGDVDHTLDGLLDVYNPYIKARDELLDALIQHGSKEFRSKNTAGYFLGAFSTARAGA